MDRIFKSFTVGLIIYWILFFLAVLFWMFASWVILPGLSAGPFSGPLSSVCLLWAYPVYSGSLGVSGHFLYFKKKRTLAWIFLALSLLPAALLFILFVISILMAIGRPQ